MMPEVPLHLFKQSIDHYSLPEKFTFPFNYTPNPLCILAANELQGYLQSRPDWANELMHGKMFGVLVVQAQSGEVGFLAAFSGNLAGRNDHSYFVPAVFDLLKKDGFFKLEEQEISVINHLIREITEDPQYIACQKMLLDETHRSKEVLSAQKAAIKANKEIRDERRKNKSLSAEVLAEMIRISQFEKAEYKRQERSWQERLSILQKDLDNFLCEIDRLKAERKAKSATLQQKLFDQFRMLNIRGEVKSLSEIFAQTVQKTPPAGAGECAAPKLLQCAFVQKLKPIAMAEFWWGASPKTEIRHHGHFYPACKGKCAPILTHMLKGLELEPDPIQGVTTGHLEIEILYEDEHLLVINKPSGLLSAPGKLSEDSVYQRIRDKYPDATGPLIVHRLDMYTSGLLLVAKSKECHKHLQAQFKGKGIKKRYIAILEGLLAGESGSIELPLSPDYLHRPSQKVDLENGKTAFTYWRVLKRIKGRTYIELTPVTGRTHQLRVHVAHPLGLNTPIVGDELYGKKAERLYLHAAYLEFLHPVNGELIRVEKSPEF